MFHAFFYVKGVFMREIKFESKEHENFFYTMLSKAGRMDSYHHAYFYSVGISDTTRINVERLYY